jgi:hypothetical protein
VATRVFISSSRRISLQIAPDFEISKVPLYSCTRNLGKVGRRGDIKRKPDAEMKTLGVVLTSYRVRQPDRHLILTGLPDAALA